MLNKAPFRGVGVKSPLGDLGVENEQLFGNFTINKY
jgi:hypothetical protein